MKIVPARREILFTEAVVWWLYAC